MTTRYEDSPLQQGAAPQQKSIGYKPLHFLAKFSVPVAYRDGQEIADAGRSAAMKSGGSFQGLHTWGEFGPILGIVFVDAARNQLDWSHWEKDSNRTLAVFHYKVPQNKSHYQVDYCCVVDWNVVLNGSSPDGKFPRFQRIAGYHGTIAIDASNGVIARLTVEADLKADDPVSLAEMMVEYGSVEIGGNKYVCPVKSLALSAAQVPVVAGISQVKKLLTSPSSLITTSSARPHIFWRKGPGREPRRRKHSSLRLPTRTQTATPTATRRVQIEGFLRQTLPRQQSPNQVAPALR